MSTYPTPGIDPRAIGSLQPTVNRTEDHGPYYLITVGEPIHRVQERDGLPHLYPMWVERVSTWANWSLAKMYESPNVQMEATNADGDRVQATPIFAGEIVRNILAVNPQFSAMGTVSLQAFAKRQDIDLAYFNRLIMPEPLWFDTEEVPASEIERYRKEFPHIADEVQKEGALIRRERLLKEAMVRLQSDDSPFARVYLAACQEILRACQTYRAFAGMNIAAADNAIRDRDKTGKSSYDRADVRRQWLLRRKGIDAPLVELVNQQPQNITVTMPKGEADGERKPCPRCKESIKLDANYCRFCNLTLPGSAQPKTAKAKEPLTDDSVK